MTKPTTQHQSHRSWITIITLLRPQPTFTASTLASQHRQTASAGVSQTRNLCRITHRSIRRFVFSSRHRKRITFGAESSPMVDGQDFAQPSWNSFSQDTSFLAPTAQQQYIDQSSYRSHKRLSSSSSTGSAGPDSPFTQSSTYPHIVDPDSPSVHSAHLDSYDGSYANAGQFSKPTFLRRCRKSATSLSIRPSRTSAFKGTMQFR